MEVTLPHLIFFAGFGQLSVLVASALVPIRLNWRTELQVLPRLHRQMYWVYGGYTVMSIVAFGVLSIVNADELATGRGLARGFCAYVAVFWGIRVVLQGVFDVRAHLTAWWLKLGEILLTVLFVLFTLIYAWAALRPSMFHARLRPASLHAGLRPVILHAASRQLSVSVLGPVGDVRLMAIDEAVAFWNEQLTAVHASMRLGPVTRSDSQMRDEVLRGISDPVFAGGRSPAWPPDITKAAGDVVIALSGDDLISVGFAPARGRKGLVILRRPDVPPLSLPNVARNVVAHELGHVLGLPHNSDPALLMCGRPAPCRPALFRSESKVFFPLTESERRLLADRFR